jgi:N-acyl-D-amino-acid deacylase
MLIKGGQVVLRGHSDLVNRDILIENGLVKKIAQPGTITEADQVLDATGCIVTPGLVDAHVHAEWAVFDSDLAESIIRQGVTTVIVGQDGSSVTSDNPSTIGYMAEYFGPINGRATLKTSSLAEYLDFVDTESFLNVGFLIPNGNLRHAVIGPRERGASKDEIRAMARLLEQGLYEGALGMSSGLEYVPSRFASEAELITLCQTLERRGAVYASHMRGYGDNIELGVTEFTRVLLGSGVAGHISHLWAKRTKAADLLETAVRDGCDISFDAYPYERGSSLLSMVALPVDVSSNQLGALLSPKLRRLTESKIKPASDKIVIAAVAALEDKSLVGMTLAQAAEERYQSVGDFVCDLLYRSHLWVGVVMGRDNFDADDSAFFLDHELHMGCSDGIYYGDRPHPRGWAAFTSSTEHYLSRGDGWHTITNHLSSRASARFGLGNRGQIAEGSIADIAVFNPLQIKANATYETPKVNSSGTRHVLIGGIPVIVDGVFHPKRAGRAIRRS